ncbi:hypothetical protein BVY02_00765 [bacterium J17]|nr:hypothetical protein BVY02_00765 [bacterium J17]
MADSEVPGRPMLEFCGKRLLEIVYGRLKNSTLVDRLLLLTSDHKIDDAVANFAEKKDLEILRCPSTDKIERLRYAMEKSQTEITAEIVVSASLKFPLLDTELLENIISLMCFNNSQHASNQHPAQITRGFSVEAFSKEALEADSVDPEQSIISPLPTQLEDLELNLSLEEQDNLNLVQKIFEELYPRNEHFTWREVLKLLESQSELELNKPLFGASRQQATVVVVENPDAVDMFAEFIRETIPHPRIISSGKAKERLKALIGDFKNHTLELIAELDPNRDFVLTATNYPPGTEQQAIRLLNWRKTRCAAYLDGWSNFRVRFSRDESWLSSLPDEVWVEDEYGFELAIKEGFPEDRIKIARNPIRLAVKRRIIEANDKQTETKKTETKNTETRTNNLLFVSNPNASADENTQVKKLLSSSKNLEQNFSSITIRSTCSVEEQLESFQERSQPALKLTKSSEKDIVSDILNADGVVSPDGIELLYAVFANKPSFNWTIGGELFPQLPHREIKRIKEMGEVAQYFESISDERT